MLAVSAQNNRVIVYKREHNAWKKAGDSIDTGAPAWKVNWSTTGGLLAVSCGEDQVKVYKENVLGKWTLL